MKKLFTLLMLCFAIASFAQVNVSFMVTAVDTNGVAVDTTEGVYIVGDVTAWAFRPMEDLGDHEYVFDTTLNSGDTLSYYFILVNSWDSLGNEDWSYYTRYREYFDSVSIADCTPEGAKWEGDRWLIVPEDDLTISTSWGTLCPEEPNTVHNAIDELVMDVYPNPTNGTLNVQLPGAVGLSTLELYDATGKMFKKIDTREDRISLDLSNYSAGIYFLRTRSGMQSLIRKIIVE